MYLWCGASGLYVPYIYLPVCAMHDGVSRPSAALLLSIMGVSSMLSRVATGWVSDRPWADCFVITSTALFICGVSTILCPFCGSYALKGLYAAVYGASSGTISSVSSCGSSCSSSHLMGRGLKGRRHSPPASSDIDIVL